MALGGKQAAPISLLLIAMAQLPLPQYKNHSTVFLDRELVHSNGTPWWAPRWFRQDGPCGPRLPRDCLQPFPKAPLGENVLPLRYPPSGPAPAAPPGSGSPRPRRRGRSGLRAAAPSESETRVARPSRSRSSSRRGGTEQPDTKRGAGGPRGGRAGERGLGPRGRGRAGTGGPRGSKGRAGGAEGPGGGDEAAGLGRRGPRELSARPGPPAGTRPPGAHCASAAPRGRAWPGAVSPAAHAAHARLPHPLSPARLVPTSPNSSGHREASGTAAAAPGPPRAARPPPPAAGAARPAPS
ncbi:translation initiation factor IF-2-like [Alexandromys fortis]|uniref:translation initiation factor IF-2-like n=1 Tax=Alexandromys fortis TaxID=100897 RepID=UPI002152C23B|nr:translation initiation factor IF-2-like [Microtus fortis]